MSQSATNRGAPRNPSSPSLRWAIPLIFLLSGACGLAYQVVWARMLIVVFGTTLLAVSTVLSAFMAGLALGSFSFGRWIDRVHRPLRVFACLEVGVGLFAFLFPQLLPVTGWLAAALQPAEGHSPVFSIVRFVLAFGLLLIPTAFMGATLPVISKFAVRQFARLGSSVGLLYAVNTLGAVAGVAVVTFVLMEALGLRASSYVVGCVNLCVAALAYLVGGRVSIVETAGDPRAFVHPTDAAAAAGQASPADRAISSAVPINPVVLKLTLVGFALQGFAALGYEVAWLRLFTVAFTITSHYEFSIVLIAFLLGLSFGSFICSRLLDARKDLLSMFGAFQILIGIVGISSVAIFAAASDLIVVHEASSWWRHRGGIFGLSFGMMLVPTLLMGASFPVVSRIYTQSLRTLGHGVGSVNAANSLGAIGGSLAAGFVLIPLVGTEDTFRVLGGINMVVGLVILGLHPSLRLRSKLTALAVGVASVVAVVFTSPGDLMLQLSSRNLGTSELLYYSEGPEGIITVRGEADGYRRMLLNGGGQVPSEYGSFQLFRLLGHLALLLHPDPDDVLVIALGGGIALGAVAQHAEVERIECVELVPQVVEAAQQEFTPYNHAILDRLEDSPIELVIDDGRNYLLKTQRRYDVITGDATHPTSTDSWVLYTKDFYELCKARLKRGGIVVQWLPPHGLPVDDFKTALRTFQSVFPHASFWRTNNHSLMVGTQDRLSIRFSGLQDKLASEAVRESLEEVDLGDPFAILSCYFFGEEAYRRYAGDGPLNTDDHPHLSFVGPRAFHVRSWQVLIDLTSEIFRRPVDISPYLDAGDPAWTQARRDTMATYHKGREFVIQGDVLRHQGKKRPALRAYARALRTNPREWTAGYYATLIDEQLNRR